MELQLGLAISSNPPISIGFDLNCYGEAKEMGSCLSSESIGEFGGGDDHCNISKKRNFDEAFEFEQQQQHGEALRVLARKTLPLLSWDNNQPNEDDDPTDLDDNNSSTINISYGEEDGVVGWPPIKSWRKKLCQQNNIYGGGGSNSTFVKVKMEGVVIARKVDLSLHHSYQDLKDTLVDMFGKGQENVEAYKLTYQDREGDWLLAGDVPWCSFIQSVQRLKLLRSME